LSWRRPQCVPLISRVGRIISTRSNIARARARAPLCDGWSACPLTAGRGSVRARRINDTCRRQCRPPTPPTTATDRRSEHFLAPSVGNNSWSSAPRRASRSTDLEWAGLALIWQFSGRYWTHADGLISRSSVFPDRLSTLLTI